MTRSFQMYGPSEYEFRVCGFVTDVQSAATDVLGAGGIAGIALAAAGLVAAVIVGGWCYHKSRFTARRGCRRF